MKKKYKIMTILFISIVLILGIGITYSFFSSSTLLNSNDQDIANFVFNAESLDQIQLPLIDLNPGDNEEYSFSVSNNTSGILSEVKVEYQLIIKTYHLVPLIIELYKLNGETEELIMTCDETFTRNPENELICNSSLQEMGYDSELLDNYKLKVDFPTEYNDETYSGLIDYINIEIKSWQKIEE